MQDLQVSQLHDTVTDHIKKASRRMGISFEKGLVLPYLDNSIMTTLLKDKLLFDLRRANGKSNYLKLINMQAGRLIASLFTTPEYKVSKALDAIKKTPALLAFCLKQANPKHVTIEAYINTKAPTLWLARIASTDYYIGSSGKPAKIDIKKLNEHGFNQHAGTENEVQSACKAALSANASQEALSLVMLYVKNEITPTIRQVTGEIKLDNTLKNLVSSPQNKVVAPSSSSHPVTP